MDAEEEIVLDINELAQGHRFYRVTAALYSLDMNYLAYAVDTVGREQATIFFKDLNTGQIRDENIENVKKIE